MKFNKTMVFMFRLFFIQTSQKNENHKNIDELVQEMNKNTFIIFISTIYLENMISMKKTFFDNCIDDTILEIKDVLEKEKITFDNCIDDRMLEGKDVLEKEKMFFIFENKIRKYFVLLNSYDYNEWFDVFKYRIFYEIYCCFLNVFDGMEINFNQHKFLLEKMNTYIKNSRLYNIESVFSCKKSTILTENEYITEIMNSNIEKEDKIPNNKDNQNEIFVSEEDVFDKKLLENNSRRDNILFEKNITEKCHLKVTDDLTEITIFRKLIELNINDIEMILLNFHSIESSQNRNSQCDSEMCKDQSTKECRMAFCSCSRNRKVKLVSSECNDFSTISKKIKIKENPKEKFQSKSLDIKTDRMHLRNKDGITLDEKETFQSKPLVIKTDRMHLGNKDDISLDEKEAFRSKSSDIQETMNKLRNKSYKRTKIPMDIFKKIQIDLKKYFGEMFDLNKPKIKKNSFVKIYFESKLYQLHKILLQKSLTEDMKKIIFKFIYILFYKSFTSVIRNSLDDIKFCKIKKFTNINSYFEQIIRMDGFSIGSEKETSFVSLNSLFIFFINYNQIVLVFDLDNTLFPTDEIEKSGILFKNSDIYTMNNHLEEYISEQSRTTDKHQVSCITDTENLSIDNIGLNDNPLIRSIISTEESLKKQKNANSHSIDESQLNFLKISQHIAYKERLKVVLKKLPFQKICFTNSRKNHASYILTQLNILDCFDIIVHRGDIEDTKYIKPCLHSYVFIEALLGIPPNLIYFYDDDYINHMMAKQRKWNSFLIKDSLEQVLTESLESIMSSL